MTQTASLNVGFIEAKVEKKISRERVFNKCRMNSTVTALNSSVPSCDVWNETTLSKAGKTVAYAIIMLGSLIGNSAIVLVIFKTQRLRTTTNFLIANMAVSDLLMPLFAMPRMMTAVHFGANRWLIGGNFGLAMCKLAPLFQDVSTAVSTQSMVLIAVDRFYNVFYPVKAAVMSFKVVKTTVPFVWLIAVVVHSPYFYIFRIYTHKDEAYCLLNWSPPFEDDMQAQEIYFVLLFAVLFIVPLCAITALYTAIITRLKRQQFPGQHQSESARQMREKRNRAILQLSVVIVMVFVVCWTPFTTYAFLKFFKWDTPHCGRRNTAFIVYFIVHSISAINPCVYFLFSSTYRQGLKEVFNCVACERTSCRVLPMIGEEELEMRARARTFSTRAEI